MKKIIYTLFFSLSISFGAFAQAVTDPGSGGNKPVIDNVNGVVSSNPIDNMVNVNLNGTGKDGNNKEVLKSFQDSKSDETAATVKRNLKFYPNPAINDLTLELGTTAFVEISLVNILGQVVYTTTGEFSRLTIAVNDYPEGSYFLSIKIGKEVIVKRIEIAK